MNDQRKVIFEQRKEVMSSDDISQMIISMRDEVVEDIVRKNIQKKVFILSGIMKN